MAQPKEHFTGDEVTAIVRRALQYERNHDAVPYEELSEVAAQFGISRADLDRAIAEEARLGTLKRARVAWQKRKKSKFHQHLVSYVIVNAALTVMNLLTGGNWVLWVIVCWGIGLAFDAAEAYFPDQEKKERGARKLLAAEERRLERDQFAAI